MVSWDGEEGRGEKGLSSARTRSPPVAPVADGWRRQRAATSERVSEDLERRRRLQQRARLREVR